MPYLLIVDTNYADEFDVYDLYIFQKKCELQFYERGLKLMPDEEVEVYFGTNEFLRLSKREIEGFKVVRITPTEAKTLQKYHATNTLVAGRIVDVVTQYESDRLQAIRAKETENALQRWYTAEDAGKYLEIVDISYHIGDEEYEQLHHDAWNLSVSYDERKHLMDKLFEMNRSARKKALELFETLPTPTLRGKPINFYDVQAFLKAQFDKEATNEQRA